MAVVNQNASIEFIVKPKEDLFLEGSLRKLPRVTKGESYPCQMQKNQNFSCLFRHYAKHNGLRKSDLIFSFVDELQADQTPETVHLMPQDEIWVEHRNTKAEDASKDKAEVTSTFAEQFRAVLDSSTHSDVTFIVGEEKVEIKAHRVILSARSQYFEAMLRQDGSMCESREGVVRTAHQPAVFRRMLEFIYTNNVRDLTTAAPEEVIALLMLANEYLLDDLRKLCEKAATTIISIDNISRLLLLSAGHNATELREACAEFVRENKLLLAQNASFRQDVEQNPELGLLLFEASLPKLPSELILIDDSMDGGLHSSSSSSGVVGSKRRRITDAASSENEQDRAHHLADSAVASTSSSTAIPASSSTSTSSVVAVAASAFASITANALPAAPSVASSAMAMTAAAAHPPQLLGIQGYGAVAVPSPGNTSDPASGTTGGSSSG